LAGYSNREIARQLGIAKQTVKVVFRHLFAQFAIWDGDKRLKLAVQEAQPVCREAFLDCMKE